MTTTMTEDMVIIDGLELCKWDRSYLHQLKEGGVTCVHACCGLWENARETLSKIGEWDRFIRENDDMIMPVRTGEDLDRAVNEGKIGIVLGTQNASPIEDELSLVSVFNRLGLKIMQLTYNNQNLIGSSCYEENDSGLSRFGKQVIGEMNRVGMVIDLSHVGERTTLDAMAVSRRPVAITHANPDWFYASRRNKSADVLHALQENGGVLGLCAYPHLIGGSETPLADFCEMVAQAADVMGVDQVGLGTDLTLNLSVDFLYWMRMGRWTHQMDYGAGSKAQPSWPEWPSWFQGPADFPNLAEGLAERGFHRDEIARIMGGNWYRFFKESFLPEKER